MTFSDWYAANVAKTFPPGVPEITRQAARQAMAACWNAALDAVQQRTGESAVITDFDLKELRAQEPSGEMQRFRQ